MRMVSFRFNIESQKDRYNAVKDKIKNKDFFQKLNFYVLPFMPEKFRARVVFLPEKFEPQLIYKKQKLKIEKLEEEFNRTKDKFINDLKSFFPKIDDLQIDVSPSLYGTLGSYKFTEDKIEVFPRYDRNYIHLQRLIITAITHYYNYEPIEILERETSKWKQKQEHSAEIERQIIKTKSRKNKSFVKIIDTEFAGHLAEESAKYLEKLKATSKFNVEKPENLTKSEKNVMNLLLRNKNKIVTFDQIAEEIWREKQFEKYSEYAITTIIKKIKNKLKQKTDKHIIQAQRGVGYILHT
jgi:hypothetical protein